MGNRKCFICLAVQP